MFLQETPSIWKYNNTLREFAYDKKDFKKKLLSIYEPLVNHLEKIYYFRDYNESVNHWKKEVYTFLHSSSLLKNNKLPPKKLFVQHLWDDSKEVFEEHHKNNVKDLNYDYGKKFCEVEVDFNFILFYRDYVDWISDYLSKKSVVSRDEVFEKIDELLEEYSR